MSPQRPRQHVLEEESKRAFANYLPTAWVNRGVEEDYGIDREVEVFEDGRATGVLFKVQLKGSDAKPAESPRRRIKVDSLEYWKRLPVRVLIVYLDSITGALYGRWAHSLPGPKKEDQKTLTVHFNKTHRLPTDPQCLARDVIAASQVLAGDWPHPIPLSVSLTPWAGGPSAAELRARTRITISRVGLQRMLSVDSAVEYPISVAVQRASIRVAAPVEVATWRWTDEGGDVTADGIDRMTYDILLGVGMIALLCGNAADGISIFKAVSPHTPLAHDERYLERAVGALSSLGRVNEVVDLVHPWLTSDDHAARQYGFFIAMPAMVGDSDVDDEHFMLLLHALRDHARASEELHPRDAGTAHYNLTQQLHSRGLYKQAEVHFEFASRFHPDYLDRAYYFRERGANAFERGDYRKAADDYSRALELGGPDADILALHADALFYAGRYADVTAALQDWTRTGARLDRLSGHLLLAARLVQQVTGLSAQNRATLTDLSALEGAGQEALIVLLRLHDALDPRIWLYIDLPDEDHVAQSVLVAMMLRDEPKAWATAVLFAVAFEAREVAEDSIDWAHFFCRDTFYEAALELADLQEADQREELLTVIHETIDKIPDWRPPFTLRVNGEAITPD